MRRARAKKIFFNSIYVKGRSGLYRSKPDDGRKIREESKRRNHGVGEEGSTSLAGRANKENE